MTNNQIIRNYLQGATKGKTPTRNIMGTIGNTLTIIGDDLFNYNTIIATRTTSGYLLNNNKYSVTTSKIQNRIRSTANELNIAIKEGDI